MAVNISVFDLANYPSNPKTVTVDITELVPYGNSGEDTWVVSAVTTATASGGATIQRMYISDVKFGWARSSGLAVSPYSVTALSRHLKVAIDEDIGSALEIALDVGALSLGGDAIAKDIQAKLNDAASAGGSKVRNLSYLNAVCNYYNGQFEIISGTSSDIYTGSYRSSVAVADGTTTTGMAAKLGFDIPFTSEGIASTQVRQTSLASEYVSGTALTVTSAGIVTTGDCIGISDGTNTEYRGVENALGAAVTLASGMDNGYAAGSLVQVLELQDPSGEPPPAYTKIDDILKFAISSILNQIDFSR